MTLTNEYQYIGRSNAVLDQNSRYSYYLLMYAKSSGDLHTGRHTVTVKQRLVSTSTNRFYGWSTSGGISINGTDADSWEWQNVPAGPWNDSSLTEDGVTYPCWVDLREAYLVVDVGYGVEKNIDVAASWTFLSGTGGYLPQAYVTAEVSAGVTLPMIASASQPSVSASSVELGKGLTIYTNRVSSFTHTLEYRFGNTSGVIARDVGDAYTWYPDIELARQIPSAVSGTAVITCTTYADGNPIGSRQVTVTLTLPESIVPTVSARWEDTSGAYGKVLVLVQNISKLQVYGDCAGAYGSTPGTPAVTLNGKAYGGGTITDSGELPLVVSVTDSRGRVGYDEHPLTVAAYSVPSLTLNASRCLEDGTADEAGDHARITVSGYVTQVNGRNAGNLILIYGGTEIRASVGTGDIFYQTDPVDADVNATMAITATLQDQLSSITKTMTLSTGYATMDFLAGGKGVSMGKAATREGFDCAMPAYFTGGLNGFLESTGYAGCFYRTVDGETEWENPPMIAGTEYRTTERYQGKPVYALVLNVGSLPNAGKLAVSVAGRVDRFLACSLSAKSSDGTYDYVTITDRVRVEFGHNHPGSSHNSSWADIYTTDNLSNFTAELTVKYTKV